MSIQIKLAGRAADAPRLPPLLQATGRSTAAGGGDRFLPDGYLQATGTFDVSAAARGGDEAAVQQALVTQDAEVVVLELTDGSTLITSAARLRDTLAMTRPELLGPAGEVLLEKLRTVGAAPGRGIGDAIGGLLSKVYTFVAGGTPDAIIDEALSVLKDKAELGVSWAGTKALMWAIEKRLDRAPGLYRWVGATGKSDDLQPVDLIAPNDTPVAEAVRWPMLVFVHGTASSTLGSFGDLRGGDRDLWAALERQFPGGIYAFEHRTLSQSPIENAIELVRALPRGAHVSLVSHSRGGLVADLLCLGDFDALVERYAYAFPGTGDADPAEAQRVLGELGGAHAEQREQLRELAHLLRERRPAVQRYVRAASPANGTKLASGNFDLFLSGLLTLIGQVPLFFGSPIYSAFKRVVIEIAKNRTNAHLVPGIEAMLPDSPMARLLRDAPVRDGIVMAVIAGDIEGGHLLKRLGVLLTDFLLFDNDDNDLVVNTTAMLAGIAAKAGARVLFDRGADVSHFRYFVNVDTRAALRDWLVEAEPRALDMFRALPAPAEYAAALAEAARASRDTAAADLPVVVLLPGVMGSHLRANRSDRVWFDPLDIASGGLAKIAWEQPGIEAEDLFGMFYGKLCKELSRTHRVERFPYDWRQPLDVLADRLGEFLDRLQKETTQPIRLLAHSMGGLVVRACIHKRRPVMDALMKRPGARLVMLGTPNQGAHSMVENLLGKGETLRTLVRLDVTHDMQEVLDIVAGFRGALQLLPKPGFVDIFQGQSDGGAFFDYQDAKTWLGFKSKNRDLWFGHGKVGAPPQPVLDAAAWLWAQDGRERPALPADYEKKSIYVFGVARNTPCGVRVEGDRLKMVGTTRGDGTVTWESGRIGGIGSYYYMPAAHGDLPSTESFFGALLELLVNGATAGLLTQPPALRAIEDDQPIAYDAGPPTTDDPDALERGLMGAAVSERVPRPPKFRLEVTVKAMDLRSVQHPIMVGQYEQDPIAGPQMLIDRDLLGGDLSERYNLGLYAGTLGSAVVVLGGSGDRCVDGRPLSGAVVTGLGKYDGSLSPTILVDAVRTGVLRYLLQVSDVLGGAQRDVPLATLLIGYNSAVNLTVAASVESLVRGVLEGNAKFAAITRSSIRVSRLEIVELYLDIAISAGYALRHAVRRLAPLAAEHGTLLVGREEIEQNASVRPRLFSDLRESYWPRLMIADVKSDAPVTSPAASRGDDGAARTAIGTKLRFLYVGQRARAESVVQQRQPGLIEKLVRQQIQSALWRPEFGRMLFQLMVPHDFKDAARQLDRVVLVVDEYTANLPWELMLADDPTQRGGAALDPTQLPLALRAAVVRQFATGSFRRHVRQSPSRTALVVGNPSTFGFDLAFLDAKGAPSAAPPPLPGAEVEAKAVADTLRNLEYEVKELLGDTIDATDVLAALYQQPWRMLHLSAHGVFNQRHVDGGQRSGVVLSDGLLITAAEIASMEVVPDLVFLNCCHLGKVDLGITGNRLAASISRELIEIGVRCVVVAGWAVNDEIARTFGEVFYRELLLAQKPFGLAVFEAREAAWHAGKGQDITWGAFQAYGDPGWMADARAQQNVRTQKPPMFVAIDEVRDELARRNAELMRRGEELTWQQVAARVEEADRLVAERCPLGWRRRPELLTALGDYFLQLGHLERAYEAFSQAVKADSGGSDVPLRTLEDMAFIEAQLGDWRAEYGLDDNMAQWVLDGERSFELALHRLTVLDELAGLQGATLADAAPVRSSKRDAMRGSAWKRKASLHARQLLKGGQTPAEFETAGQKMIEALEQSIEAYRSSEGLPGSADFNVYLALNRLSLDALTDWAEPAARDAALLLVQQCRQVAQERAQRGADAWDALMPCDALLTERLLDGNLGRSDETGTAAFDELSSAYAAAFSSVAVKPALVYAVVKQLEILSRFCDALSLVQHRDEALSRTADRLLQLVQRIQPRRSPRGDRPENPVDWTPAAAPPDAAGRPRAAPPKARKAAPRAKAKPARKAARKS
jgi:tetratricopeptide (TPR) repeat protein